MSRSCLLSRVLAAVTTAATLVALPTSTGPAHAASAACTSTASAASSSATCDIDTDGDGLVDSADGCPTAASTNPTGCPTAPRKAALTWLEAKGRLQASITSPVRACAARAPIVLWRVRPGRDVKLVKVSAGSRGRHRFRVPRGASYYVTVSPSYASGKAECASTVSRTVRVPRG